MSQAINADIMDFEKFPNYDLLYTDPPWGLRMVKWFNTQHRKDTGTEPTNTWNDIFNQLGSLADKTKPMVIEYQVKDAEEVIRVMTTHGHTFVRKTTGAQSNGRPFVLLHFNCHFEFEENLKGFEFVTDCVKKLKPQVVFDPFAGMGKTAQAVQNAGASYIGAEMNPERFKHLQRVVAAYENL
jgi:succinate dehydrogenase/fumarate reductase flavoprotein subunit